jgi:hypothetical protein
MHPSNIHLHLISANEYWELDSGSNSLQRKIHAPKSLHPHLTISTDDLLGFYWHGTYFHLYVTKMYLIVAKWYTHVKYSYICVHVGIPTIDSTRALDDPGRHFVCKGILLNWNGDYPAQSKCAGTHDKVCHWCTYKSEPAPEINRRKWGSFRQWLPPDHRYRTDNRFGP